MEFIPENEILQFKSDTLDTVRRNINLNKPGEMKAAIKILREWIQQQPHLRKKDFRDFFLETSIVGSKGSIERAKKQIDKSCTMRTLLPHFYGEFNVKKDFESLFTSCHSVILPKQSKDGHRVYLVTYFGKIENSTHFLNLYRYAIILAEYLYKISRLHRKFSNNIGPENCKHERFRDQSKFSGIKTSYYNIRALLRASSDRYVLAINI
ncbi:uncharacterized protein LOC123700148 [Colias croceus]|uniref:uncharacterized protein LOC123700148 n=1 Tax=Colias crocea TaxID=72248 RepID=UPI001E27CB61|nr:uncharacterized protein LOC123700148 [Colias croceus]